jgi:hypothetical protein
MIKIDKKTKEQLVEIFKNKKISLEGNILKIIDTENDDEFANYIKESIDRDKENRRKRLEVTRQVQSQNTELTNWKKENEIVNKKLIDALKDAEDSNKEMLEAKQETETALKEAQNARIESENARNEAVRARQEAEQAKILAVNDLEIIQKKGQFELIGDIVKVALLVILGVGVTVTLVYVVALCCGVKAEVIGSAWVNIMSILLTNSFSIIGTLMGMKTMSKSDK